MKRTLIGLLILLGSIALGVGAAFGVSRIVPKTSNPEVLQNQFEQRNAYRFGQDFPRGMMGGRGFYGHMSRGGVWQQYPQTGERLTIDEAQVKAEDYASSVSENLKVSEVMEFSNNFYAVVVEKDSAKGAFELLIDPYTGQTNIEMGPAMMWNTKYGHRRYITAPSAVNTLTMEEAAAKAQSALDLRIPGAKIEEDGIDFYGYYSFDYELDGKIAGMLSVNGEDGQVSFHFWHDTFIDEKEIE